MRLRNIKNATQIIESDKHFLKNPEQYKGKFKSLFKSENLEIEIGSGKGNFIISKAKSNPNINYIAIEKYPSVLVGLIKKLNDLDLPNLKVISYDAALINDIFENEVDKVYLNFSDPWPKKSHAKRRLTHENFLKEYDKIFKTESYIEMKTDNYKLFSYSLVSLSQYGYKLEYVSLNLHEENIENHMTEYEKKFSSLGQNIYKVIAKKNKNTRN